MRYRFLLAAGLLALTPASASAQTSEPLITEGPRLQPVLALHGMVASQEAKATRIGIDILERGGNAVDAAVAVGFALAVTLPRAGNLGGGGFMLVHLAARDETIAIDYRETAPQGINRESFLDEKGEADPRKSRDSGLAVGVPGTVAGLALAWRKYGSGRFGLAELIAPAIRLAREGFVIDDDLADSLPRAQMRLARWPASARIFLKPDGVAPGRGERLQQGDLADTLTAIARFGPDAFYRGPIADMITAGVRAAGGVMTSDDLARYRPVERKPVRGSYRGYDVRSMPPPSSGGVHLVQLLNILEGFALRETGAGSAATLHMMIEAMKLAYADRAAFLGDPDAVRVPVQGLTSKDYAADLRAGIDLDRARPSAEIRAGQPLRFESDHTTHFSVVDRLGNAVANTYTLNFSYGLGLVATGTGVLLNNELDDFAVAPGAPNAYGLTGGEANAPGPGRRPLSSMTPVIILRDGRPFLVTGSPGGSRIITTVLQVICNVIDHGMTLAEAVAAPRIHHQWTPDAVIAERGISPDTVRLLQAMGHRVSLGPASGSANSVRVTPEGLTGAADPRQRGTLAAGH